MPQTPVVPPTTEYESVIDQRLRQTRRQVKTIDVASRVVGLLIAAIVYLFAASLTDHWLVAGGLPLWARLLLWLGLVGGTLAYLSFLLLPPMLHRINPLFAAATIEKSEHTLKNSLINFLLLRGRREEVAGPFYRAMESRAAADLSKVKIEVAVDRTHLLHLVWALAIAVALFVLYLLVSPKSPLSSAARILLPWSNIEAPTRVTISDVLPGDKTVFHGDSIEVSAVVNGLHKNEPLLLVYGTADGQIVDQSIPMEFSKDGLHYRCDFPPGNVGFQQDCVYFLAGGDCRTPAFHVRVETAPAITVDSVTYHYLPYVGRPDRTVKQNGHLSAIEGTEVTIRATANTKIRPGSAEIDLGCTGGRGVDMTTRGRSATGHFTLRLKPGDSSRPEYDCYQIRFENIGGKSNPHPVPYHIDVIRDMPPDVQLVDPPTNDTPVAENGSLPIKVRAKDPDFALRSVSVAAAHGGRGLSIAPLLEKKSPAKPWPGEFLGAYSFEPLKLGLKAGDRVEYWAEAEDNREPDANRSTTEKHSFVVVAPGAQPPPQDKQDKQPQPNAAKDDQPKTEQNRNAKDDKSGDDKTANDNRDQNSANNDPTADNNSEKDSEKKSETKNEKSDNGKNGSDQQQKPEQSAENRDERTSPEDPGDVIEKILKDRQQEQQQKKQENNDEKGTDQKGEKQQGEAGKGEKQDDTAGQKGEKQQGETGKGEKQNDTTGQKGKKQQGEAGKGEKQDDTAGQKGEKQQGEAGKGEKQNDTAGQKGEKQQGEAGKGEKQNDTTGQKGKKQQGETGKGEKQDDTAGQKGEKQQGNPDQQEGNPKGDAQNGENLKADGNRQGNSQEGRARKSENEQGPGGNKADTREAENKKDKFQPTEPAGGTPDQKQSPGAGHNSGGGAPPKPEGINQDRPKKPGEPGKENDKADSKEPQTTSKSDRQSDSRGDSNGDKSGGGSSGGGQQATNQGIGNSGSHTAANDGGSKANQSGEGETGEKAGDKTASKTPTGGKATAEGDGKGSEKAPDANAQAKPGGQDKSGAPQQNPADGGRVGGNASEDAGKSGASNSNPGGGPGAQAGTADSSEHATFPPDEANLDYARRQTELALEHLRDQLAKEKPRLLDRLGWTKEEARRFLDKWEAMKRMAAEPGPQGDTARKEFNDAIRGLGLRPRGTELRHGGGASDKPETLHDPRNFAPPPDWDDQMRAYTRGVAGADREEKK
jgi:hypothetical protein